MQKVLGSKLRADIEKKNLTYLNEKYFDPSHPSHKLITTKAWVLHNIEHESLWFVSVYKHSFTTDYYTNE